MPQNGFDAAVKAYREALDQFLKGDPEPAKACFSRRDDVTLANPLGPPRRGAAEVGNVITDAAANFRDGSMRIEELSRYSTPDLGYVVQLEQTQARFPGSDDMTPFALRATVIFRREEDTWKVVHRHADPITTARPISSVVQT